jgi:transcriptional regulator of arginine metabolism
MSKAARLAQILKLIRTNSISTQSELAGRLAAAGFKASQVTLSRDIRELKLVKTGDGYREHGAAAAPDRDGLQRVFREFLRDIRVAQNLVVLKTAPGGAPPVARALDAEEAVEIVGTVAGDDTIFVATPSTATAKILQKRLIDIW